MNHITFVRYNNTILIYHHLELIGSYSKNRRYILLYDDTILDTKHVYIRTLKKQKNTSNSFFTTQELDRLIDLLKGEYNDKRTYDNNI